MLRRASMARGAGSAEAAVLFERGRVERAVAAACTNCIDTNGARRLRYGAGAAKSRSMGG